MKKYVKEIWVKFSNQAEYSENEERLFALLDRTPGDCEVNVYDASVRSYKALNHRFDETQLSLLIDAYVEENVQITTKTIRAESRYDIFECCGNCIERIADELKRIADALEESRNEQK